MTRFHFDSHSHVSHSPNAFTFSLKCVNMATLKAQEAHNSLKSQLQWLSEHLRKFPCANFWEEKRVFGGSLDMSRAYIILTTLSDWSTSVTLLISSMKKNQKIVNDIWAMILYSFHFFFGIMSIKRRRLNKKKMKPRTSSIISPTRFIHF